jgi:hypothetical protein
MPAGNDQDIERDDRVSEATRAAIWHAGYELEKKTGDDAISVVYDARRKTDPMQRAWLSR